MCSLARLLPVLALVVISFTEAPGRTTHDPPPITILVLDDVGWELLGLANTPHLDALAANGITFTQAWAYPSCTPARTALFTGRYAWRTGVGNAISWTLPGFNRGMELEEVTIAELLPGPVDLLGKWHASHRHTHPNQQGFRHYLGGLFNLGSEGGTGYYNFVKTVDGAIARSTRYATTDTTDDALASTAPVRVVAYHAIHNPAQPPPGGAGGSDLDVTLDMLEFLDREIGRLLAGYEGYVLVISDNGSEKQYGGAKGTLKEGGVRVPMFAAGPGIVPRISDDLVSIVDIFATVAELRGVPIPTGVAEDSVSLVPILRGLSGARETVLTEMFWPNHNPVKHSRAIRNAAYKLIVAADNTWKLFSMPGETKIQLPWSQSERAAARELYGALP